MKSNQSVKAKIILVAVITLLLASITVSANAAVYTYDSLNRLTSVTYKNGQRINYTYDQGGNMLTVDSDDADTPPTVKTTDPTDGATDVSVSANVYVTFSETVVEDVYFNDIHIKNAADSSVVDSTKSLSGDLLTIDPIDDLNYSITYAVYIPAGSVKDGAGNSLVEEYDFSLSTVDHPYIIKLTSPNGAENWQAGATKQITWTYAREGIPTDARISLYKGGLYQHTIVNSVNPESGSYNWTIPGSLVASDDYKIRITSNSDVNVYDYSDADFTISGPIAVTSPNGGENWLAGATKQITWTYAGEGIPTDARISLYKGGVYQRTIVNSVTPESRSYDWSLPGSTAAADDYKIRITSNSDVNVYDYSDADFTISGPIAVTSPNGGENWQAGATKQITWTYAGEGIPADARISLYKGDVYQYTIVNSVNPESGSYSWTIPGSLALGDDYKVRITSNSDVNVYDYSDAEFTISGPIAVTAPNGGENWQAGATKQITWTYAGEGIPTDARISLYKSGLYQRTIVNSVTPESGSYNWTIPGSLAAGDDYKIRITSNTDVNVYDYSDADFTISTST